jgi:acetyl-CoA synthetase
VVLQTPPRPHTGRAVTHNLLDYEAERATFSWAAAARELAGLPDGGGVNIAYEAVGRHARTSLRDKVAIRWLGRRGQRVELSFGELDTLSNRFANVLRSLGVGKGDHVFILTGRIPELYVAALGALKNGSVLTTLFSAFGPEPIAQRLQLGSAKVLVTTDVLYQRKVAGIRDDVPTLNDVIIVGTTDKPPELPATRSWTTLLEAAPDEFEIPPTDPEQVALLHFTSGTTGKPKGALHVHRAVVAHRITAHYALDLQRDDVYWCTADPGWVTGTSYGIIAPLVHGVTSIVDESDFDAERWYSILQDERVTVWYTSPTAVRSMMRLGPEVLHDYDLSHLRFIASVGEPLNPEAVLWGQAAFGMPIHDNWWQTETGAIMIANYPQMPIRPGSMGRPMPGIEAAILRRGEDGKVIIDGDHAVVEDNPDVEGMLALRPGWPSMFRGYLNEEERYRRCFVDGWYLAGDLARRDADGYFWFVGRADDLIKSSGHLIGPFEVESALMEFPAVAEAGVIGKPDAMAGEVVKAFVSLKIGHQPSDELRLELLGFARQRLGAVMAPKEIEFTTNLPKTRSGKIMRRLLRARELGLPEGDVSTLEGEG